VRQGKAETDREFEVFVAASWPRLLHTATLLTRHEPEAEDLVQTVLMRVYASWPKLRLDDPQAYTRRALVNAYVDGWRRRRPLTTELGEMPCPQPDPDQIVDDRDEVLRLLVTLSPRERAIVVMRYYLDASEADVAHALSLSAGTVKSTASRALAKLRVRAAGDPTLEPEEIR